MPPDVNVNTNPLPNHGNSGVNALSGEYSTYFKKRVSEVRRPMTVLFEILSRAGLIPSVHGYYQGFKPDESCELNIERIGHSIAINS